MDTSTALSVLVRSPAHPLTHSLFAYTFLLKLTTTPCGMEFCFQLFHMTRILKTTRFVEMVSLPLISTIWLARLSPPTLFVQAYKSIAVFIISFFIYSLYIQTLISCPTVVVDFYFILGTACNTNPQGTRRGDKESSV